MHDVLLNPLANSPEKSRGAIYTRREVVETILDLVGYTADFPLWQKSILEPCCGQGDFLLPIIARLIASYRRENGSLFGAGTALIDTVRAVEISTASHAMVSAAVVGFLEEEGVCCSDAEGLAAAWVIHSDFLLTRLPKAFDFIVGNPPYLRQERIPESLLAEYRRRYATLYDRADIYVPFIERSLNLLRTDGRLGFICSDRWMKNRYGGPLRRMVSNGFHLKYVLSVNEVPAFTEEVIAYPAIFVVENTIAILPTRVAASPKTLDELDLAARQMTSLAPLKSSTFRELRDIVADDAPWLTDESEHIALIRRMERDFPTLEEAGCRVGIGVATGADRIFIAPFDELDVEDERKLPLVGTRDIASGRVVWRGHGIINPFEPDGTIADLDRYPRFAKLIRQHEEVLRKRHVAQRSGAAWYRTIDRITTDLVAKPKLLIPDIKGAANVVYEEGRYYPHHNLYFVLSETWDLWALQAVLRSRLCQLFISSYSLQMQGGYFRFQAQYLRRLCVPKWETVRPALRKQLAEAARSSDAEACDRASAELFGLDDAELAMLEAIAKQ